MVTNIHTQTNFPFIILVGCHTMYVSKFECMYLIKSIKYVGFVILFPYMSMKVKWNNNKIVTKWEVYFLFTLGKSTNYKRFFIGISSEVKQRKLVTI